jgi:hypothetical protein
MKRTCLSGLSARVSILLASKRVFILVAVCAMPAQDALAHSSPSGWPYPKTCCANTGEECDPIPPEKVRQKPDGNYEVILDMKDHKYVPWDHMPYKVTPGQLRSSGDNLYHACIRKNGMHMDCLIIPFSN